MLDKNTMLALGATPKTGSATRALTARDLLRFVRLRRVSLLVPTVAALVLAYAYLQAAVPVFSARAQVIIDPRMPQFIPGRTVETILAWDSAQVESEIAVLSSERIAGAVVTKLGLDRDKDFKEWATPIDRIRDLIGLRRATPKKPDKFHDAVLLIQDGLNVRRSGLSYAIDISFSYPEAFRTSEIANAVAEAYIADQLESRSQAARVGGEWLQNRMMQLRTQMNESAKAVQVFRASHNYAIPARNDDADTVTVGTHVSDKPAAAEDKTLDELDAAASTYKKIYESFLQSYTESVQRQSFPVSDARILTPASIPDIKSAPREGLIFALAGLVGLLCGTGVAVFNHNTDRVLRSAEQVEALELYDGLGSMPRRRADLWSRLRRRRGRPSPRLQAARDALDRHGTGRRWWPWSRRLYFAAALDSGEGRLATAIASTRTLVDLIRRREDLHTIGFTAPHVGAGSSLLASNLASLAAVAGTRTLVIDADLGGRGLTRAVLGAQSGGAQASDAETSLGEAVVPLWEGHLDLMPAHRLAAGPGTMFTAEAMESLLRDAQKTYGLILVDLPPLLPIGTALDVSAALDGIVLTVEAGKTTVDQVSASAEYLARVHAKVLGAVINKADG